MTCTYCATNSATYAMSSPCCAVRFILSLPTDQQKQTAEHVAARYGHTIERLREQARAAK